MRTKIFFTTLLLFVGLITNAQKEKNSSGSKSPNRGNSGTTNTQSTSSLTDSEDTYTGKTKLVNVTTDVYFLNGVEENMGVVLTKEGVVLIDTEDEEEMTRSLKIINRLNKKLSINYLISTSNTLKNKKTTMQLKKDGTIFLAQNFSTKSKGDVKGGYSSTFKPDISFKEQIALNFEREKVEVISLNNSGNSAVYLSKKNVLFTGPVYSNKKYPEINSEKGKSLDEISKALSKLKSITNEKTKIVPGLGELAKQIDLVKTSRMLETIYKQVYVLRANGKTLEEVLAMKSITKNYDSEGYGDGPITTEIFITSVYNEIAKEMGPLDTRTYEQKAMDHHVKESQKNKEKN